MIERKKEELMRVSYLFAHQMKVASEKLSKLYGREITIKEITEKLAIRVVQKKKNISGEPFISWDVKPVIVLVSHPKFEVQETLVLDI